MLLGLSGVWRDPITVLAAQFLADLCCDWWNGLADQVFEILKSSGAELLAC